MTTAGANSSTADPRKLRVRRSWWRQLAYLGRRAFWLEVRSYQSIYRLIFRRPRVPAGHVAFSYHQPVMPILIVLIAVSAVELVVVDVVVHRFTAVRVPLLVAGIWGLVWMVGLLCGMLVRPHGIGSRGIRVRSGAETDLDIPWTDVQSVRRRKRNRPEKEPKVAVEDGITTLHLRISDLTNIEIFLEQPTPLRLPHGRETVDRIALYAEDPQGFMTEVRRHIG